MFRLFLLLSIAICSLSCDSKLTDEQRKALREEMDEREIKKIGQEEIYQKALEKGRELFANLSEGGEVKILEKSCNCLIQKISSVQGLTGKEAEVFEAYSFEPNGTDNVQKDGQELLIYSKPVAAGDSLSAVWFIRFEKKEIIKLL